jgi:hypothetical protein
MRRLPILSVLLLLAPLAASAGPPADGGFDGSWTFDASASSGAGAAPAGDSAPAASSDAPARASGGGKGMRGGGMGGGGMGGMGGGGMGGMGGGHGGGGRGGGRHGGGADRAAHIASNNGADAERNERGLARLFAAKVTITPLAKRIRFDDGNHPIELDRDGTNISGPGVGGTVALTATQPDLVVETLTESGYMLSERYHLAEDGHHLEMHASLKRPGADATQAFVRVFDRNTADAKSAPAVAAKP